jgi:hypothetical protein
VRKGEELFREPAKKRIRESARLGAIGCFVCMGFLLFLPLVFCKGKMYQFLLEKCARRSINKNRFQPKTVPRVTRKVYHPLSL